MKKEENSLIKSFGFKYWCWAQIHYHTDPWGWKTKWLNDIAEHQMNKIAKPIIGHNVFWEPKEQDKDERI